MKAIICKQPGPPESLVFEDIPSPTPADNEISIDVAAAGVNFPDTLIIRNKYQIQPELPFIPGSEAAGVVSEIGPGVDNLKPGDRVICFGGFGAFAEKMVVPKTKAFPIPDLFDFQNAAAFSMAYGTAYHALHRMGHLKKGDQLLVLGAAGGVGLAAVHLGKIMGAEVIAAASNDKKLSVVRQYGADVTINYSRESLRDEVKKLTGGRGVDMIYDPVGGDYLDEAIRLPAFNGVYLLIGFSSGRIPMIPANIVLLKGFRLTGVHWGRAFDLDPKLNGKDFTDLLELAGDREIKPLIHKVFPLQDAPRAMRAILNREVIGKIVLSMD